MPEGDTIFRAAAALRRALQGKTVLRFETALAHLQNAHDDSPVTGRIFEGVESRGKWLLMHFSGDMTLVTHMRMNGSWHIYRPGERWRYPRSRMRIVVVVEDFEAVAFDVPVARFHTRKSLERDTILPRLGPDLLQSGFTPQLAVERLLAHPEDEVANALLNQQIMAGVGNVFKSEICFACGLNPFRRVASLARPEIECLVDTARRLLAANVRDEAAGGIVTWTGGRRTTGAADPGARLWVYRRAGRLCRRCGTKIFTARQGPGARSTYWCPQCQPVA